VDPEARLARKGKGKPALLSHSGHALMENRSGLCVNIAVDEANGTAEREQAAEMLLQTAQTHGLWPKTLGADAGYAAGEFLTTLEAGSIKPHVAGLSGAICGDSEEANARRRAKGTQRTRGYAISQRIRKRVEEIFGWCKSIAGLGRTRFVGRWKIQLQCEITGAAYNLLRMARLAPPT
jgi:hypothetical protein